MDALKSYACSFVGRRKNNEDSYIISEPAQGYRLFAVADGMGGFNAGEVASSLAIESISNFFRQELISETEYSDEELKGLINRGFKKVQLDIAASIRINPSYSGMGTTLLILLNASGKWFCGNIGDSRLYIIRNDTIKLLTKDHTLLQQYLDSHEQSPDNEWIVKYSNCIVKALDGGDSEPDVIKISEEEEDPSEGSCFILCSDGILPDKRTDIHHPVKTIVHSARDIQEAAEQLVSYAYYDGSADNITVVLVETDKFRHKTTSGNRKLPFPPTKNPAAQEPRLKNKRLIYVILSAILVCIIGILLLLLRDNTKNQQGGVSPFKPVYSPAPVIPKVGYSVSSDPGTPDNKKKEVEKPIPEIIWQAFNQDDYRLPVNGSTMIIWNPFNDSSQSVSRYRVRIYLEGKAIDSIEVRSGINSVRFDVFKKLQTAKKYSADISAYLSNGQNAEGNRITFTYH